MAACYGEYEYAIAHAYEYLDHEVAIAKAIAKRWWAEIAADEVDMELGSMAELLLTLCGLFFAKPEYSAGLIHRCRIPIKRCSMLSARFDNLAKMAYCELLLEKRKYLTLQGNLVS